MYRNVILTLVVVGAMAASAVASPEPTVIDRDQVRKELAEQRKLNLKRFRDYRRAGIYPHNTYENGMLNVWRDDEEHLCAVANLIAKQGLDELVNTTASGDNFVKIAEVTSGPLLDWVLTSGFTQEEIAMIQWPTWAQDDPVGYQAAMREIRRKARERRREDQRLAAGYLATERTLKEARVRDAGLDVAVARLMARPELVAALHARSIAK